MDDFDKRFDRHFDRMDKMMDKPGRLMGMAFVLSLLFYLVLIAAAVFGLWLVFA